MSNATEWTAQAIRTAIAKSGLTKVAISDTTGIPYPTLNRKVAGKRDFTLSELLAIAEAIGVHPETFIPPQFTRDKRGTRSRAAGVEGVL
ncbi:MAG: helix-turn-helix transcriptional regulator [Actinomyces sp.]|uniref:helix-turn-helix domain-containing protein n=1 Tax=Actinomyces sp. TaxID=29317 RepID=UPI0026DBDC5E|nr:helix-turn-helix transcriptional regulator [Actinomyces sp.]MDO4243768.1 helix-turn-helix transcriptional regulator [Actinomyces sp.]